MTCGYFPSAYKLDKVCKIMENYPLTTDYIKAYTSLLTKKDALRRYASILDCRKCETALTA